MDERKRLVELRAELGAEIKRMAGTLTGGKTDFTAEERQKWDRINREFDAAGESLAAQKRAAEVSRLVEARATDIPGLESRGVGESRRAKRERRAEAARRASLNGLVVKAWVCHRAGRPLSRAMKEACRQTGFSLRQKLLDVRLGTRPGEYRALSVGTATAGGNLVPAGFGPALEIAMSAFGGVRAAADVIRTDTGNPLPWPTANDTGNTGELLAENADANDAGSDPSFGQVTFGAHKYSSKVIRVSHELMEDAGFDMAAEMGTMAGERLGRVQAPHLATGTGTGQPQGIVTGSALGKAAASATAIAGDELIDLQHSVNVAYRRDPSCGWVMNDSTLAVVRKLKDGQGNYLWTRGDIQNGIPETLLGWPITIDLGMPNIATGTKPILCGPLKKYKIRDVNRVRLRVLQERYAERDQIGFVAFLRTDARHLNAGTGPIKHLVMA